MYLLLWLLAFAIFVFGVVKAVHGEWLFAIILFIVAILIGPGGVFIGDFL